MSSTEDTEPIGEVTDGSGAPILLLLGTRDEPTDGIFNDSTFLAEALTALDHPTTIADVPWDKVGIVRALRAVRGQAPTERPAWVILQFTPLAWGPRGFPIVAPLVVSRLRRAGVRVGISFHDSLPTEGDRVYDRVRRVVQVLIMRRMARRSDRTFFHVAPKQGAPWLRDASRATWLPTGTAIPSGELGTRDDVFTVGVFCLADSDESSEAGVVGQVLQLVALKLPRVRLLVFGRGAARAEHRLRADLEPDGVIVEVHDIEPEAAVGRCLSRTDVLLFVRTGLSSRRSTFVAALAYGLPIVGYANAETGWPVDEAGVILVGGRDVAGAASGIVSIGMDQALLTKMQEKSETLFARYFAWPKIAERLSESLR